MIDQIAGQGADRGSASVVRCTRLDDLLSQILDGQLNDPSASHHRGWMHARQLAWAAACQVCELTERQSSQFATYDADIEVTVSVRVVASNSPSIDGVSVGQRSYVRTVCYHDSAECGSQTAWSLSHQPPRSWLSTLCMLNGLWQAA